MRQAGAPRPPARGGKNALAILSNLAASRLAGFVVVVSIARVLPVEQFGLYVLALATAEFCRGFVDWGIDQIAIRRLARDPEANAVVTAALLLKLGTGALSLGGIQLFAWSLGYAPPLPLYLLVASLALLLNSLATTLATAFQARLLMAGLAPITWLTSGLRVVLVGVGIAWQVSALGFLLIALLVEAGALGLTYWRLRRLAPLPWPRDRALYGRLFREALPLGIMNILALLYLRIDTVILSRLAGETAVAQYGAMYRLTETALAVAIAISATSLPLLAARLGQGPPAEGVALYQRSFRLLLAYATLAACLLTLLAEPLVRGLYGMAYVESAGVLVVLAWAILFMSLNILQTVAIIALDRSAVVTAIALVNLVVNVGLNLVLIPRLGVMGAAISTVGTEAINSGLQFFWLTRRLPLGPLAAPLAWGLLSALLALAIPVAQRLAPASPATLALAAGSLLCALLLARSALGPLAIGRRLRRRPAFPVESRPQ